MMEYDPIGSIVIFAVLLYMLWGQL